MAPKQITVLFILALMFLLLPAACEKSQYYNETSGQMEVPITVIGGTDTDNYISFCSLKNTDINIFDSVNPVNWDRIYRYNSTTGMWSSAYYFNYWRFASRIEPVEAGACYNYRRKGAAGSTTWIYDIEFYCKVAPTVDTYSPGTPHTSQPDANVTFNVTFSQTGNITWYLDGVQIQTNNTVASALYLNTSPAIGGPYNVTASFTNDNGSVAQIWSWTVQSSNQCDFTFTNSAITPTAIRENEPFTVTVDINDSDGTITTAIVKISDNNYTMTNTAGDTWSYTFTATSLPTQYYVQNFYAQDNDSAWNSITSTMYIDAASSTGTGSSGGISPTPTPIIPSTTEVLFIPYKTTIFGFNSGTDNRTYIKEMEISNMTECTYTPDVVNRCVVNKETVRIIIDFDPDTTGPIYKHKDFIKLYDGKNEYYTEFEIYVINFMASANVPENNLQNPIKLYNLKTPSILLFSSNDNGTISGIRIWWPLMLIIIAGIMYFKKKGK